MKESVSPQLRNLGSWVIGMESLFRLRRGSALMTPSLIPIDIFIPKWLVCLMDICGILSLKLD